MDHAGERNKAFLKWVQSAPSEERRDRLQRIVSGGVLRGSSAKAALKRLQQRCEVRLPRLDIMRGVVDYATHRSAAAPNAARRQRPCPLSRKRPPAPDQDGGDPAAKVARSSEDVVFEARVLPSRTPAEIINIASPEAVRPASPDPPPWTTPPRPSSSATLPPIHSQAPPQTAQPCIQSETPPQPCIQSEAPPQPAQPCIQSETPPQPAQPCIQSETPPQPAQPCIQSETPPQPAQPCIQSETPPQPAQPPCQSPQALPQSPEASTQPPRLSPQSSPQSLHQAPEAHPKRQHPTSQPSVTPPQRPQVAPPASSQPKPPRTGTGLPLTKRIVEVALQDAARCIYDAELEMKSIDAKIQVFERLPPLQRFERRKKALQESATVLAMKAASIRSCVDRGVVSQLNTAFYPTLLAEMHKISKLKLYSSMRLMTMVNMLLGITQPNTDPKDVLNTFVAHTFSERQASVAKGASKKAAAPSQPQVQELPLLHTLLTAPVLSGTVPAQAVPRSSSQLQAQAVPRPERQLPAQIVNLSSSQLQAAPLSSSQLQTVPRASSQLQAVPRSSSQLQAVPRSSSQLQEVPRSSSQLQAVPRSSSQQQAQSVPRTSSQVQIQAVLQRSGHLQIQVSPQPDVQQIGPYDRAGSSGQICERVQSVSQLPQMPQGRLEQQFNQQFTEAARGYGQGHGHHNSQPAVNYPSYAQSISQQMQMVSMPQTSQHSSVVFVRRTDQQLQVAPHPQAQMSPVQNTGLHSQMVSAHSVPQLMSVHQQRPVQQQMVSTHPMSQYMPVQERPVQQQMVSAHPVLQQIAHQQIPVQQQQMVSTHPVPQHMSSHPHRPVQQHQMMPQQMSAYQHRPVQQQQHIVSGQHTVQQPQQVQHMQQAQVLSSVSQNLHVLTQNNHQPSAQPLLQEQAMSYQQHTLSNVTLPRQPVRPAGYTVIQQTPFLSDAQGGGHLATDLTVFGAQGRMTEADRAPATILPELPRGAIKVVDDVAPVARASSRDSGIYTPEPAQYEETYRPSNAWPQR